jgi:Fe2+ transport system protein FeoA
LNLSQPASGYQGVIARVGGDKVLKRKLMSPGIRQWQPISVLHQRKNGVIVMSNGSLVALGSGIVEIIFLESSPDGSTEPRS